MLADLGPVLSINAVGEGGASNFSKLGAYIGRLHSHVSTLNVERDYDMARKAVQGLLAGARANSGCLQQMPHAQLNTHEGLIKGWTGA